MASTDGWVKGLRDMATKAADTAGSGMQSLGDRLGRVAEGMRASDPMAAFKGQGTDAEINAAGKAGGTTPPVEPPVAPRASPVQAGTQIKPWNPIEAQAPGVPGGPTTPIEGQGVKLNTVSRPAPTGQLSPEASAAAREPQFKMGYDAPKTGAGAGTGSAIGKGLRTLGKMATPAIGIMGAADAIKNGPGSMDYKIGGELTGDENSTLGSAAAGAVNVARRIGNAAVPDFLVPNAGNKLVGGLRDVAKGDQIGTTQFPADQSPSLRSQAPVAPQVAAPQGDTRPVGTSQGLQTPQELISGTAVPNPGSGAFQRTGGQAQGFRGQTFDGLGAMNPNATQQEAVDYLRKTNVINQQRAAEQAQTQPGAGGDELAPLRRLSALDAGAKPGHAGVGSMAALGAYGALDRMKSNSANLSLRAQQIQATNAMTMATKQHEWANQDREFANKVGQQNEKTYNDELETMAAGKVGNTGLTDSATKAATATEKARLHDIAKYSVADTGKDLGKMSSQERQQLYQAIAIRDKIGSGRDNLMDYFGNHQVDSKNAYSYMPDRVTPAARPGDKWVVHTKNGNQIALKELADGSFSLFGANKPVDADMMALVQPLIDKARRGQK